MRRELGVRTLFNLLGPMTNPAGAQNQVMGVFHRDLVPKLAQVLQQLGSRHVLVVHAADGLDEISLGGDTYVAELREGDVSEYTLNPQQFGLDNCSSEKLAVHNIDEARAMLLSVFDNHDGPAKDIVALNAGAAIYVGGAATTLQEGIAKACAAIESGAAKAKLEALVSFTQRFVPKP